MGRITPPLAAMLLVAATAHGQVTLTEEAFAYDASQPAAGLWSGNVHMGEEWWYAVLRIGRDEQQHWSIRSDLVSGAMVALGVNADEVKIDGPRLTCEIHGQRGAGRLEAEVSENGQRLRGTFTTLPSAGEPRQGTVELARGVEVMDLPSPMVFTGKVNVQGLMEMGMTFAFAKTPQGRWVGHVDVPVQATQGYVLANLVRKGQTFTALMPGPMPAHLTLRLVEDQRRLAGTLKQGPAELVIDLPRDYGYAGFALHRPQNPRPPYPYEVREVTIPHPDGHTLAGTLTVPATAERAAGPFPAAVLVSGSGPQDRDESIMGHKPFLVIADALTRRGIAVLRYDDRGTARSTGSFTGATTEDFATDALAAVQFLRGQSGIDGERVGVIGHSEGGLIAPMVAAKTPLAFAVLMAGPGVPGSELLAVQAAKISSAEGADEQTVAGQREQQQALFALMGSGASEEKLRAFVRERLAEATGLEGAALEAAVDGQVKQVGSPWLRWFIGYDPRPALAAMTCPVLALNGTRDLQVWHEQNLDEIERVMRAAGRDVTARRYEGLNHLFQPAETGRVGEYADIETTIDPQVLDDIVAWIDATLGPS